MADRLAIWWLMLIGASWWLPVAATAILATFAGQWHNVSTGLVATYVLVILAFVPACCLLHYFVRRLGFQEDTASWFMSRLLQVSLVGLFWLSIGIHGRLYDWREFLLLFMATNIVGAALSAAVTPIDVRRSRRRLAQKESRP